MTYNELFEQVKKKKSFLCVGLDSDIKKIPAHLLDMEDPVFEFNKAIVDATADVAIAYKPNIAFYESRGVEGWRTLKKTVKYIKSNYPEIFMIADAKRGDIGNTAYYDVMMKDRGYMSFVWTYETASNCVFAMSRGLYGLTNNDAAAFGRNVCALRGQEGQTAAKNSLAAGAPRMLDYLCDDCRTHFEQVKALLSGAGVAYTVDPSIVRGLDYYSRTVFEFVSDAAGAQGTVLGGGRYDTLLEQMDSKPVPAVGFAAGMERLLLVMEAEGVLPASDMGAACYLAGMDDASRRRAFLLAQELRGAGIPCETDLMERSVKAQFKYADKTGARFVAVLGERELAEGAAEVKDLRASSSERVKFGELADYIKRRV